MNQLVPVPYTKAYVRTSFLTASAPGQSIPCYLIAVEVALNEALRWMILTEEGACYNSVPLHALCLSPSAPAVRLDEICGWDALGNKAEAIVLDFLTHFPLESRLGRGRYMFSIHFDACECWARIPEQLKVFHICEREDRNLMCVVNNETRFLCGAFEQPEEMLVRPEANRRVWFVE